MDVCVSGTDSVRSNAPLVTTSRKPGSATPQRDASVDRTLNDVPRTHRVGLCDAVVSCGC
ncbi:hypothetical protein EYF80_058047 [Liparis tanakae]|uniref:Uncharacterized protein n=1 Tax=Liparis tanakae TaxID=230148 RepID=A0A4Z2ESH2_9TELE|nr:hypothetical protein EYF80_058047 [Liparis tanakae]